MSTGVIINLNMKSGLKNLMMDAQVLFQIRVKHALKKAGNLKVYAVLATEFQLVKPD